MLACPILHIMDSLDKLQLPQALLLCVVDVGGVILVLNSLENFAVLFHNFNLFMIFVC